MVANLNSPWAGFEDDEVEFGKAAMVRCRPKRFGGDEGEAEDALVAFEAINPAEP
jgi:hypothetical protein